MLLTTAEGLYPASDVTSDELADRCSSAQTRDAGGSAIRECQLPIGFMLLSAATAVALDNTTRRIPNVSLAPRLVVTFRDGNVRRWVRVFSCA